MVEKAKDMDYPDLNRVINRIGLNSYRVKECGNGLEKVIEKAMTTPKRELLKLEFEKRLDTYEQTLKYFIRS